MSVLNNLFSQMFLEIYVFIMGLQSHDIIIIHKIGGQSILAAYLFVAFMVHIQFCSSIFTRYLATGAFLILLGRFCLYDNSKNDNSVFSHFNLNIVYIVLLRC
jgi:hypothetical protein